MNYKTPNEDDNSSLKIPLIGRIRFVKDKQGQFYSSCVFLYWLYGVFSVFFIVLVPGYEDGVIPTLVYYGKNRKKNKQAVALLILHFFVHFFSVLCIIIIIIIILNIGCKDRGNLYISPMAFACCRGAKCYGSTFLGRYSI